MIKNFFDKHNIEYKEKASLKNYNTYKIDATSDYVVFPKNEKELIIILKELKNNKIRYLILGNGSNVIFSKSKFDGVIIKLDKLNMVEYNDTLVQVGAGYPLIKLAMETIEKGLSGLEFAAGIPGCIGASTAMNAGAYNSDMACVVKSVKVLTPNFEIKKLDNNELEFAYRDSFLKRNKNYVVLSTTFNLSLGDTEAMKKQVTERRMKRYASQPLNMPSAGSVFRNPENMYAGELIEKLNLKGRRVGGAEVSQKHANFIVNVGNATGNDIIELIKIIKKEVKSKYDVDLKLEQIIIE